MDKDFSNFYIRMLYKFPATDHQQRLGFLTAPQLSSVISKEALDSYKNEFAFLRHEFDGQIIETPQGAAVFYNNRGFNGFSQNEYGFILLYYIDRKRGSKHYDAVREYLQSDITREKNFGNLNDEAQQDIHWYFGYFALVDEKLKEERFQSLLTLIDG